MAINFPGPQEIRLNYVVTISNVSIKHQARYNVFLQGAFGPGANFSDYDVFERSGITQDLQSAVDNWVALMQPLFNASNATITTAELWDYEPGTFVASFLSTYDINLPGTSGSSSTTAGQVILTLRSQEGGIMKVNFMESIHNASTTLPYSTAPTDIQDVVDKLLDDTNVFQARDTSFPFAFILYHPGQNEATFKKRNRPF